MRKTNYVKVTAKSVHPHSGENFASPRDEIVDLKNNQIFQACYSLLDVKKTYEAFWNDLPTKMKEMVLVIDVVWATKGEYNAYLKSL